MKTDSEWGQWCHKIYIVLKVVAVDLVEASQNWVQLQWANKIAPDHRPKAQFLTLLGEGTATTTTLGGDEKNVHVHGAPAQHTLHSAPTFCGTKPRVREGATICPSHRKHPAGP